MSMRGSCRCNNIGVIWHTLDYSVVPRACPCEYCSAKGAAYVGKPGTAVSVLVHNACLHLTIAQGSGTARFHECGNCGDLVLVTAQIDGELYGVLNATCMHNAWGFSAPVRMDFAGQSAAQKQDRWQQNWSHPVAITGRGGELLPVPLPAFSNSQERV